jgi:hypothetical protein
MDIETSELFEQQMEALYEQSNWTASVADVFEEILIDLKDKDTGLGNVIGDWDDPPHSGVHLTRDVAEAGYNLIRIKPEKIKVPENVRVALNDYRLIAHYRYQDKKLYILGLIRRNDESYRFTDHDMQPIFKVYEEYGLARYPGK